MYKIIYQKSNGQLLERIRNTLPQHKIGEMTSMGWIILDIQYCLNKKYYSYPEYRLLLNKQRSYYHLWNNTKKFIKKYSTGIAIIIFLPLYLFK